jgi:hypothetical protein
MSKSREAVVIAKAKKTPRGVVPGEELGKYRKTEFAVHALPSVLRHNQLLPGEVGIFRDGRLVPQSELSGVGKAAAVMPASVYAVPAPA